MRRVWLTRVAATAGHGACRRARSAGLRIVLLSAQAPPPKSIDAFDQAVETLLQ